MTVQPDLCQTCSETTLLVFPRGGSFSESNEKAGHFYLFTESELQCTLMSQGQRTGGQSAYRTYSASSSDLCQQACQLDSRCDHIGYYYDGLSQAYVCSLYTAEELQIASAVGYSLYMKTCSLGKL